MKDAAERTGRVARRVPRCRGCGLPSAEGRRMVAGPGVFVCESCVALLATRASAATAERCAFCGRRDVPIAGALPSLALCAACLEITRGVLAEDDRPSRPAT
jgi:hypothetical protein